MSEAYRIGLITALTDPFWVQVVESLYHSAQLHGLNLVPTDNTVPVPPSHEKNMILSEELLAQELDGLIAVGLSAELIQHLLDSGMPIIHLSETDIVHPLSVSPLGLYEVAQLIALYLLERLNGKGHIVALGGLLLPGLEDDGKSRIEGFRAALAGYPQIQFTHFPAPWSYEEAFRQAYTDLQRLRTPVDAIFGLSDTIALAARDAGQALRLVNPQTLIVGINGDPLALAAIAEGTMAATVETSASDLGHQAIELALRAARKQPLPAHFSYKSRLVTAQNVAEVAAQKLITIADLPSRLVGDRRQQQRERLIHLETSLEISCRVGTILDPQHLSREIANLIRMNYGYDQVQLYHWLEDQQLLLLDQPDEAQQQPPSIPLAQAGVCGQAILANEPVFIPDLWRSSRFPPEPHFPKTRSRVAVPIRLRARIMGVLDLHCYHPTQHTRQKLVGLQSLADQLAIAMHNAELYAEALAARAMAEKANQLKTRLLANVSHELRTPLDVILGYSQGGDHSPFQSPDRPTAWENDLHHIRCNAEHLKRLINDLLDLSRAEIGELDLAPEMIDPRPLLEDVFHSMAEARPAQNKVVWRLQLPQRLPLIQADPVRLRQMLLNLLHNAQKFTAAGQIVLGAEVNPPHLDIWLQDTGMGIPADLQERIFEPFVTAEYTKRRGEGVGLGLAVTRRLVALHRGFMTLESQVGQGSTFHIYLPLPAIDHQPSYANSSAPPMLLWISHQDQPVAEIADLAQRQGLKLYRVRAGDDLKAILAEIRPAALIWDLARAGAEDWALIEQLRQVPQLCQLPFIVYGQEQAGEPALVVGVTNFIVKPVAGQTLLDYIHVFRPVQGEGPILIVDDNPHVGQLYQNLIVDHFSGYTTVVADSGLAALEIMSKETPCLVLLDLIMPELDGYEVLAWMRTHPQTRQVPVLVMSGHLLTMDDIKQLEHHARVIFHSKGILSGPEMVETVRRSLLGGEALPQATSALVKRTLAYIHQHYPGSISRADLAQAIGVSENYLSRIFRLELGLTPWDYLVRYRIERARTLLDTSHESVTNIAARVGFNDSAYFSRVFHQQVGVSPRAYRQNK